MGNHCPGKRNPDAAVITLGLLGIAFPDAGGYR
jgi:hypothetical protein